MKYGFVQFKDNDGKTVTTNGSLSLIQDCSRNLAFYGSRGKSELSNDEYKAVIEDIGYVVPVAAPAPVAATVVDDDDEDFDLVDDDDEDFVLPV